MGLDLGTVRDMASLARLALTPSEEELLARQLERILNYFSELSQVETDTVPPATDLLVRSFHTREDRVTNAPAVEDFLASAPAREGNCFVVPKIID